MFDHLEIFILVTEFGSILVVRSSQNGQIKGTISTPFLVATELNCKCALLPPAGWFDTTECGKNWPVLNQNILM